MTDLYAAHADAPDLEPDDYRYVYDVVYCAFNAPDMLGRSLTPNALLAAHRTVRRTPCTYVLERMTDQINVYRVTPARRSLLATMMA